MSRLSNILHSLTSSHSKQPHPVFTRRDLLGIVPGTLAGAALIWLYTSGPLNYRDVNDLGLTIIFLGPTLIGYLLYRFQLALRTGFKYPLTRFDVLSIGLGALIAIIVYSILPTGVGGTFDILALVSFVGIGGFCMCTISKSVNKYALNRHSEGEVPTDNDSSQQVTTTDSTKQIYPILSKRDLIGIVPGILTGAALVWLYRSGPLSNKVVNELGLVVISLGPVLIGYLLYRLQFALRTGFKQVLTRSDALSIGFGGLVSVIAYIFIPIGVGGVFDVIALFSFVGIGGFCVYVMSKLVNIYLTGASSSNSGYSGNDDSQQVTSTDAISSTAEQPPNEIEITGQSVEEKEEKLLDKKTKTDSELLAPETIPTTPHFSISYDDIEKGDPIGSGGNANVYRAIATADSDEIVIAMKEPQMSGTIDTETIEQLINEAETWQQLDNHDHIVSVVDYGSNPLPWIGMEYMDGGDLSEVVNELSFSQALWTGLAITKGVRYAHKRGVAHLDLKPSNILFRSVESGWDVPKIADWGLSKHLLEHSQSVDGMSPRYAAPEQLDSEQFGQTDTVTDVYQLGTVLYELFTGEPPFDGETYEVMNKIQSSTPVPPSERADLPDVIDDVLMTALATERGDRYDDVIYIRDALQDIWEEHK